MKPLHRFTYAALLPAMFYCAGAFYEVNFNIADWSETSRGGVAWLGMCSIILVVIMPGDPEKRRP